MAANAALTFASMQPVFASMQTELSVRLSEWRSRAGLSLVQASEVIGASFSAIASWERGEATPSRLALPALATALGIPLDELRTLVAQAKAQREATR